jgi:outer membrane protein, heavy metal efflux system
MRQLVEATRTKYEAGRLRQSDILRSETELAQMEEARVDQRRAYSEAQTELNSLMNRPPQSPLGPAVLPPFQPADVPLEALQQSALENRPQLAAAASRIKAAQARVGLAERARFPDPEFRIEARQFNGSAWYDIREYDTAVFISLPWVNRGKYRAAIREAKKLAEVEAQDGRSLQTDTAALVRDVWLQRQSYRHHVELFRNRLLPLARQTVEATRSSYEADRATLLEVVTAQHTVQDTEAMLSDHLAHYFIAEAELRALTGLPSLGAAQP